MSDFRPLFPARVPSSKPEPVEPLAWFEVIATRFPEAESAPNDAVTTRLESDGVHRALFTSIDAVAEREARKRRAGDPEPADVALLRTRAAAEAERLVAEAHHQARLILDQSREQGYRRGYEAGHASGTLDASRQLAQRADDERLAYQADLTEFMSRIERVSRRTWAEMEPEILSLVFEIARKVIKMEVELNREAAVEVVKNTLRRVADSTSLRIRVHADDLATVRANREELYTLVDTIRKVEIVEDRRVGLGGCIVETDAGTIDARIETQLEEIRKMIHEGQPAIRPEGETTPTHAGTNP